MKERAILSSSPMVRAILDGLKTVTRRICKPAEAAALSYVVDCRGGHFGDEEGDVRFRCPYGQPGDRLWVRETFKPIASGEVKNGYGEVRYGYAYRADSATWWNMRPTIIHDLDGQPSKGPMQFQQRPWRSPATMPHRASRITLEVTGVRVERLQDISDEQAIAEGLPLTKLAVGIPATIPAGWSIPRAMFRDLWESTNGAGSWDANPWVWVVEFRRIEQEARAA